MSSPTTPSITYYFPRFPLKLRGKLGGGQYRLEGCVVGQS